MPIRHSAENRGPGAQRFDWLIKRRPPEKLVQGKQMLYEHALRCFCKNCGSLLNWDCPTDLSYTEAECCGLHYRLQPWTVRVDIEDVSSRPLLPKMEGSDYADPDLDLGDRVVGETSISITTSKPLSDAQKSLTFAMPTSRPQVPKAPSLKPAKKKRVRRCGACRQEGHDKRTCPD